MPDNPILISPNNSAADTANSLAKPGICNLANDGDSHQVEEETSPLVRPSDTVVDPIQSEPSEHFEEEEEVEIKPPKHFDEEEMVANEEIHTPLLANLIELADPCDSEFFKYMQEDPSQAQGQVSEYGRMNWQIWRLIAS